MTPEQRIVHFVELLKSSGAIRFYKQFYDTTGIRRQYFVSVRSGKNRFTTNQIEAICKNYEINANWIFGVSDQIYRYSKIEQNDRDKD